MLNISPRVLVCEDDQVYQRGLRRTLEQDFDLHFVDDGESLLQTVQSLQPHAIILDVGLRGDRDGFEVLPRLRALCPGAPVIVHSGTADYGSVVEAMRLGAADYVAKKCPAGELKHQLSQMIERHA